MAWEVLPFLEPGMPMEAPAPEELAVAMAEREAARSGTQNFHPSWPKDWTGRPVTHQPVAQAQSLIGSGGAWRRLLDFTSQASFSFPRFTGGATDLGAEEPVLNFFEHVFGASSWPKAATGIAGAPAEPAWYTQMVAAYDHLIYLRRAGLAAFNIAEVRSQGGFSGTPSQDTCSEALETLAGVSAWGFQVDGHVEIVIHRQDELDTKWGSWQSRGAKFQTSTRIGSVDASWSLLPLSVVRLFTYDRDLTSHRVVNHGIFDDQAAPGAYLHIEGLYSWYTTARALTYVQRWGTASLPSGFDALSTYGQPIDTLTLPPGTGWNPHAPSSARNERLAAADVNLTGGDFIRTVAVLPAQNPPIDSGLCSIFVPPAPGHPSGLTWEALDLGASERALEFAFEKVSS